MLNILYRIIFTESGIGVHVVHASSLCMPDFLSNESFLYTFSSILDSKYNLISHRERFYLS